MREKKRLVLVGGVGTTPNGRIHRWIFFCVEPRFIALLVIAHPLQGFKHFLSKNLPLYSNPHLQLYILENFMEEIILGQ